MTSNNLSLDLYLYLILAVKIIYYIIIIIYLRAKFKNLENEEKLLNIKNIIHKVFNGLMIFLMLYLFFPSSINKSVEISGHTRLFLFIFAILSLISLITEIFTGNNHI